jgi:hypothetical protein
MFKVKMHDICPNSMSMVCTKESLTVDAEDGLRENNTLLNRNSRMCPVPPQGVLNGLNTSFAAAILHDAPETNRMATEKNVGRFGQGIGSHLFRPRARTRFASLIGIRNQPTLQTPIPSPNGPYLEAYVASSSQGSSGNHAQATVQQDHLVCDITSPSPSMSRRPSTQALAWQQPERQSNLHEPKSVVDSILLAYPNYIGFIV